ncbi:kinase-like domain-containing protein [Mycena floridula]|nr:kinase-like domain-containing protein [Mycena floridula]
MPGTFVPTIAPEIPDLTGCILADGRYKLIESIRGPRLPGRIYKAIDLELNSKSVMIKCTWKPKASSPEEISLNRRIALHRRISSHSNVLAFIECFTAVDFVFVVSEFFEGGYLQPLKENHLQLIIDTMVQLIDVVQYCHQQSIYHQDLRPENLWLGTNGRLYIADFEACTERSVVAPQKFRCGSSVYLSPEAIGDRKFSAVESDIWSIGIILVVLITGLYPWSLASHTNPYFANFVEDPQFMCSRMSESANDILRRVLNIKPQKRTSLAKLRKQILSVDTFFKTDETHQLCSASDPPPPYSDIISYSYIASKTKAVESDIQVSPRPTHKVKSSRCHRFLKRVANIISQI